MVHALKTKTKRLMIAASLCGLFALGAFAQQDPSYRVARLNHIRGNVSMEPAGVDDWVPAETNRPFTTGDYLYTDDGAQAELHLDVAVMRMGPQTSFGFLNLDDQTVQIKLSEGQMQFRIRNFGQNQVFEVDTPNAALTFLQNGSYTVSVDPNGNTSFLTVREGQAQVTGGGQAFTVDQGSTVNLSGTDELGYDVQDASQPDQFEDWSYQRDQHESQNNRSSRYLPPSVIGYEDLDDYGGWQSSGQYGNVWYPNDVQPGWAPYHNGHWAWIDPWGYTWVDDAPWGFAPFHYGRWVYISNRWGWCPGPMGPGYGGPGYGPGYGYGGPVVRPYYAPALVAFFGGSHFGISIGFGGGESLGWVPLSYGEIYTPPYAVSQTYFRQVNVTNTRITNVTNITNVYNTTYVNHQGYNQSYANARAPGAVMAMPQSAFASGRQVRQVGRPVPVNAVSRLQSARILAPRVVPTRQAFVPTAGRGPAPRPSAQVLQRQVVARKPPPPPPVPVAAREAYLRQHAGQTNQPYNHAAMRQAVAPTATRATPVAAVRQVRAPATAAKPVVVRPGQRGGNVAALPAARTGQPASAARPGQPSPAARPGQPTPARPGAETRQPAAAGHGAPPNIRQERPNAPNNRPAPNPANAARPGQPAPTVRPGERAPAARPEGRPGQPAPDRGTPPNMREGNRERPAPRSNERTRPSAQPESRVAQPAARPEARPESRSVEPVRPAARPAPEARPTRPEPRSAPEARPARPEARPTPAERREARPAPEARQSPQHGTPPNRSERPNRDNRDTREPR